MIERPLLARPADDLFAQVVVPGGVRPITVGQCCADIESVAAQLPDGQHVVNLCQGRYAFLVVFFAAMVRGQINLLPGKRDGATARQLAASYPGTSIISDQPLADTGPEADLLLSLDPGTHGSCGSFVPAPDAVAAIVFTSGSTGEPQAHRKTWAMFGDWRREHWRHTPRITTPAQLVATVPPWHMYGLEWSVLVPTIAPLTVFCGPDFFPRDVVSAMDASGLPSVLVTTPLHLRALTRVPAPRQPLALVISATAPIDEALVADAQACLQTTVFEIYGCSEIGSLADRLPARHDGWHFFDCFELQFDEGVLSVMHAHLPGPVPLADLFEPLTDGTYRLLGRAADVVKVGGKRESLARLNGLLMGIDGVVDGVFFLPEQVGQPSTGRLGAVVVAPGLSDRQLRDTLTSRMDPVFLPRPLLRTDRLPRNATGKLERAAMVELLTRLNGLLA